MRKRGKLTEGSDKVRVCIKGLVATSVLEVPHADSLVVRRREEVLAVRVEDQLADPVIVSNLKTAIHWLISCTYSRALA